MPDYAFKQVLDGWLCKFTAFEGAVDLKTAKSVGEFDTCNNISTDNCELKSLCESLLFKAK